MRGSDHQAQNFAPFCFTRADEQEQLDHNGTLNGTLNGTQNGTQNGNHNRTLDLNFYLGIYGGEQLGLNTHRGPVKSVSRFTPGGRAAAIQKRPRT